MNARCPSCLREQIARHPGGIAVFDHGLACPLLAAQDATQASDVERAALDRRIFTRPATEAERILLAAGGFALSPDGTTRVEPITRGIVRRTWPGARPVTDEPASGVDLDAAVIGDAA